MLVLEGLEPLHEPLLCLILVVVAAAVVVLVTILEVGRTILLLLLLLLGVGLLLVLGAVLAVVRPELCMLACSQQLLDQSF